MTPFVQFGIQWKRGLAVSKRQVTYRRVVGPLFVLLALFTVQEAWGETRYVSKSGVDNPDCTQAAPCRFIQHAVNVANPDDTISIGKGKFLESYGVTIAKNLTVNGSGTFSTRVYGAWPGSSIFKVELGVTVTITGLDVMGGNAQYGGGILNHGVLTLEWVRVWKNSAKVGGGIFNWNDGTLYMSKSEIAYNSASDGGGGLHNQGFAELNEVRIVKNYADAGSGGIQNSAGGGWPGDSAFSLVARRSEVSHNAGNGIDNWSGMSLTDTTVSRNHQVGIFTGAGGYTELLHVTVAENGKGPDQHPDVSHGGLQWQLGGDIELYNTIVANNAVAQCLLPYGVFSIATTSSLFSDGTCGTWPGGSNLVGNPKLGPLKWNGGLTSTHALKSGSPAIDAGGGGCSTVDQRGVPRTIDGNGDGEPWCDIGAFEYIPFKYWKNPDQ